MRAQRVQLEGLKMSRRLLKIMVEIVSDSEIPVFRFIADLMRNNLVLKDHLKLEYVNETGGILHLCWKRDTYMN